MLLLRTFVLILRVSALFFCMRVCPITLDRYTLGGALIVPTMSRSDRTGCSSSVIMYSKARSRLEAVTSRSLRTREVLRASNPR